MSGRKKAAKVQILDAVANATTPAKAGHNSDVIAGDQLLSFLMRVERLNEEIAGLNADKSDVFKEAKGFGYNVKILRQMIRDRNMDKTAFAEQEALLEIYRDAVAKAEAEDGTGVATRARTDGEAV